MALQSAETPTIRNISSIVAEDECSAVRAFSDDLNANDLNLKNSMLLPRSSPNNSNHQGNVCNNSMRNASIGQMDMDIMMRHNQNQNQNETNEMEIRKSDQMQLRRLKSESAATVLTKLGDEEGEDDLISNTDKIDDDKTLLLLVKDDPPSLNNIQQQQHKTQLPLFQTTRSYLSEMSFTECGVKDIDSLDAIFIDHRKSKNAASAFTLPSASTGKNSKSATLPSLDIDNAIDSKRYSDDTNDIFAVPSLHMARHLHSTRTISSGSGSFVLDEEVIANRSYSFEEASKHVNQKTSALKWLKELSDRDDQVAEAASSKFLTQCSSAK